MLAVRPSGRLSPAPWSVALALTAGWCVLVVVLSHLTEARGGKVPAAWLLAGAGTGLAFTMVVLYLTAWAQLRSATGRLAEQVSALELDPSSPPSFEAPAGCSELMRALQSLAQVYRTRSHNGAPASSEQLSLSDSAATPPRVPMTRSGLYDYPSDAFDTLRDSAGPPSASAEFAGTDMVNRLEPRLLRWIDSSPAEQRFLGWDLARLREKSFLEIVHPDDVDRVRAELKLALTRGEAHGLVLRVRTAQSKRVVMMNVGTRYGPDLTVSHLRCHLTDVTAKVRADRELRLRTRELTQVNEQLVLINRELGELQERYRDLYQNAPAMYFSMDENGVLIDCNQTLLETLGYRRETLVNRPYVELLPAHLRPRSLERFKSFLDSGTIEVESQWTKADGEVIDVWISGTAVRGADGRLMHSRSVAQDVTARHRLEAELKAKNEGLARANDELSRRNKEMDEFTYVVSHDLQEPLRTLIAFSDFLMRDYGDRLDDEGREFVRHLVDASRRMRSLIQDLLTLSRAGKVTSEFAGVNLEEVVAVVRADLSELIRSKGAEVVLEGPVPELWGDQGRLTQLLANLVGNGLKYNESLAPRVVVRAAPAEAKAGGGVVVAVSDNGIGIDPEYHDKIFKLFRRLHNREDYEGTGAGLAICLKIVQAHHGRVWVESEPGAGSTFFVSLPARPRPGTPPP